MESRQTWKQKYQKVMILIAGLVIGAAIPLAYGAQPHMDSALGYLQSARGELEKATPNKGGHRERAIQLVDQALVQVREGIKYSNTH